jgi:hypothetical protein
VDIALIAEREVEPGGLVLRLREQRPKDSEAILALRMSPPSAGEVER